MPTPRLPSRRCPLPPPRAPGLAGRGALWPTSFRGALGMPASVPCVSPNPLKSSANAEVARWRPMVTAAPKYAPDTQSVYRSSLYTSFDSRIVPIPLVPA